MPPSCRCLATAVIVACVVLSETGAAQRAATTDSTTHSTTDSTRHETRRDTSHARALREIRISGRIDDLRGVASTASQGYVGATDLRLRPLMREGELLETVPGLIVTQHSGSGKSNQLFVRGFNLDHGTDFSTRLEGMPVNQSTHAHGQGYTDLNFIIPEFVDHLEYRLGNYHASIGDFGSAGGAEFQLKRTVEAPFVSFGAGAYGHARLVGGASHGLGGGTLLLGGEARSYDGPWEVHERQRKLNGLARYTTTRGASRLSLLALGYRNQWNASDQVPMRAVASGLLSRYGQIDPSLGGESSRSSLSGDWQHVGARSTQQVQLFVIRSSLDLFSNFTYFLDDESGGDQFNQRESRTTLGANVSQRRSVTLSTSEHLFTLGVQHRSDLMDGIGLHRTRQRRRTGTIREDDVTQHASALYVEAESRWHPRVRTTLGMRGDLHAFDVRSGVAENSGRRSAAIASPKASIIWSASGSTELYLSAGLGFHSNDARGTVITIDPNTGEQASRVDPLVRSRGSELGARFSPSGTWRSTVALWALSLDSELLFVGDGGTTEPTDGSRRHGLTLANFYRPTPSLALDADISFARARLVGVDAGANRIPGALQRVVAAGVAWNPTARSLFAAVRLRHFGSYPLIEDNSVRAQATTLVNALAGTRLAGMRLELSVLNVLGSRASDIQYYYPSRLPGEPAGGVPDLHFHPVEPRQVRLVLVL